MKKLYFFSDIHGNLPAIEAVIDHIGFQTFNSCDKYFLGDYVNFCAFNNEVINLLRNLENAQFIEGNHDIYCATKELDYHQKYGETIPEMIEHITWVQNQISQSNLNWLASHPKQITFKLHDKNFLLFHGYLDNTDEKIDIHDPTLQNYDFVFCGHTHRPFIQHLNQTTIVNVGSIGEPLDGDNRPSYVVLENDKCNNFNLKIERVTYDYQQTINRAEELKMPFRENMIRALTEGKV